MGLTLKIQKSSIGSDCKSLVAIDNTGIYSGTNDGYRGELQVTSSTILNTATMVINFTIDGTSYTVTRGAEYAVISGDNEATATAIAVAIDAKSVKISSIAMGNKVYIFPTSSSYVLEGIGITDETHGLVISQQYRDKQALKVFCLLMRSAGRETKDVPAYTPNGTAHSTSWSIAITEDAWYEFFGILVPVYVPGKTYLQDNIVYLTDTYYKVKVGSTVNIPSNVTDWEVCTTVDQFEEGTNTITSVNDNIVICWSNQCLAKANALYAATGGAKMSDEKLSYERIRNYVEGAGYNGDLQQFTQAQLLLERISEYCAQINCSCGG